MGFIFGGGEKEDDSDDDQRIFRSSPDRQPNDSVTKQEQKVQREEIKERRRINNRMRKMKTGGMRQLVSQDRDDPTQGNPIQQQRTLGPGRNPR